MVIPRGEDRPLLVSMLDSACGQKGSDEEAYADAKWGKPLTIRQKWKAGRIRGRAKSMALGAASIINKWPEHLTICWLFAMGSCMLIVACILMLIGASRRLDAHPMTAQGLQKQCILHHIHNPSKLLEKTNIHLHVIINEGESFNPYKYKNALKETLKNHPSHAINIYVLLNDTSEHLFKRNSRFKNWELSQSGLDKYKFFDTSSAESGNTVTPLPLITVNGINEQSVKVIRSTFSNYFQHSPLSATWTTITPHALPIVFRVLTLWEYGGITMPWQMFLDQSETYNDDRSANSQLRKLVKELQINYTGNAFETLDKHILPHQLLDDLNEVINLGGLTIETGMYSSPESPLVVDHDRNNTEQIPRPITDRRNIGKTSNAKKQNNIITPTEGYKDYSGSGSGDSSSSYYSESSSYSDVSYSDHLPKSIESQEPTILSLRPAESDDFVAKEIDRFVKKGSKKKVVTESKPKIEFQKPTKLSVKPVKSDDFVGLKIDKNVNKGNKIKIVVEQQPKIQLPEPTKLSLKSAKSVDFVAQDIDKPVKKESRKKVAMEPKQNIEYQDPPKLSLKPAQEIDTHLKKGTKKNVVVEPKPKSEPKEPTRLSKDENKKRVKRSLYPTSEETKPYVVDLLSTEGKIPSHILDEYLEYRPKEIHDPFKELVEVHAASKEVILNMNDAVGRKLHQPLGRSINFPFNNPSIDRPFSTSEDESSSYSDSTSDSSESLETFKGIFGPMSDGIKKPKIKRFHEDKSHRLYEPFEHMNVFALPRKMTVSMDQFGYYFATKKPCHAYLGHLIALLQSLGNLEKFQEIIPESLRTFCGKEKLSNCDGIMLV